MAASYSPDKCDEGGSHVYVTSHSAGCFDWFTCFLCCPCYAILSCACSNGAALANPAMEQLCGRDEDADAKGPEPQCSKCGLSRVEASYLSEARRDEAAGRRTTMAPGHFNQAYPELTHPGEFATTDRRASQMPPPRQPEMSLVR